jgi:hypothetical protein
MLRVPARLLTPRLAVFHLGEKSLRGARDVLARLALQRASIMHLVGLKRRGYSPCRTELRIAASPIGRSPADANHLLGTSKNRRFPPPRKSDSKFSCSERGRLARHPRPYGGEGRRHRRYRQALHGRVLFFDRMLAAPVQSAHVVMPELAPPACGCFVPSKPASIAAKSPPTRRTCASG